MMTYQKLYVDESGESHWEDVTVKLEERTFAPPAKAIEVSPAETAKRTMFLRLKAGWDEPIHPDTCCAKADLFGGYGSRDRK